MPTPDNIRKILMDGHAIASGTSYLTQTNDFLNANTATFTTAQKGYIDRLVSGLLGNPDGTYTTYNVWSKLPRLFIMVGGTMSSCKVDLITPGSGDFSASGSPTFSTNGVALNGTSQYLDSGAIPNTILSTGMIYHRRDSNNDGNASMGMAHGGSTYFQILSTVQAMVICSDGAANSTDSNGVNAWWGAAYSNSSTRNSYRNRVNIKSQSKTQSNAGDKSILLGAFNGASPVFPGNSISVDVWGFLSGTWSDNEYFSLIDGLTTFNASWGR